LIFVGRKTAFIGGANGADGYHKCLWNNYTNNNNNIILNANITFNGYDRLPSVSGKYLNYVQPYKTHRNIPNEGINLYSFSIFPEAHQPSGSCNFSMFNLAILGVEVQPSCFTYYLREIDPTVTDNTMGTTTLNFIIYARSYNILRIIGGMGALAYV